ELEGGLEAVAEVAGVQLVGGQVDADQRDLAAGPAGYAAPRQRLVDAVPQRLGGRVGALLDGRVAHDLERGHAGRGRDRVGVVGARVRDAAEALPVRIVAELEPRP